MKKYLLLLFPFVFAGTQLFAYEIKLDASVFRKEKLGVVIDTFIDARINKSKPIGFTRLGLMDKPSPITVRKDLAFYCDSFFNACGIKFGARKFIAVINQLTVQELQLTGNEYSDVCLGIDYYEVKADGSLELYCNTFRKSVGGPFFDATEKHAQSFSSAFLTSFIFLNEFLNTTGKSRGIMYQKAELINKSTSIPVPADTVLKEGFYFNNQQVLLNAPVNYEGALKDIDTNRLEIYLDQTTLPLGAAYAVVKHKTMYLSIGKNVYHKTVPLFATGKLMVLDVQNKKSTLRNPPVALFGVVGGVVETMINPDANKRDKHLFIDLNTGLMLN